MSDLVPTSKETRIAPWGARDEIREIARRVQLMAPGAARLGENEALALAQGAVAHGLDPFNGEIWFIPGSGLMAGIKGLRKAARKQLPDGATFWCEFEMIGPDEKVTLRIPAEALAFRAILRDSVTLREFTTAFSNMVAKGVPAEMVQQVLGKQPFTVGIGSIKPGERTKMDPAQCAMKRAEADAVKRRFDLPFATPAEPDTEGGIIDGEWVESHEMHPHDEALLKSVADEPASVREAAVKAVAEGERIRHKHDSMSPEEIKAGASAGADALYGAPDEPKPAPAPGANGGRKPDLATAYWKAVIAAGLDRPSGKAILDEKGGDFAAATEAVTAKHTPPGASEGASDDTVPF